MILSVVFQAKPAECFSAVEKLLMACCTMQPEDGALPRGDAEGDGEVYHKNDEESSIGGNLVAGFGGMVMNIIFLLFKQIAIAFLIFQL